MASLAERRAQALAIHRGGELDDAERRYRAILGEAPEDGETWHYLAVLLGQRAQPAEAARCCGEALQHGYRTAAVYANLAIAARSLGDGERARDACRKSLALDPTDADLTFEFVELLRAAGDEREALHRLQEACRRFPEESGFYTELGGLAAELNDGPAAERAFRQAVEVHGGSAETWLNLGNVLQMRGELAGAEDAYRRALAIDPALAPAWLYLAQLVPPARDPALADAILAHAAAGPLAGSAAMQFAAAAVQHGLNRTDLAFAAYAAGNGIVRRGFRYTVETDIAAMESLAASLNGPLRPAGASDGEAPHPQPVFIVGLPRSGSTLIEHMLARHPEISAGGEIVWLQRYVRRALQADSLEYPAGQAMLGAARLREIRRRYGRALSARHKSGRYISDKLPANFLCVPSIRRLFPGSLIIHARRDLLETCWSCYRHLFSGTQNFAWDLVELGRYGRAAMQFLETCRLRWPDRVIAVDYEALVASPEQVLRTLLERLRLDWDPRCLQPQLTGDLVMTASAAQLFGGLATAPRRSAGQYRGHLEPLRRALEAG